MNKYEFTVKLQELTPKPRQVLQLLIDGESDHDIALALSTSSATVRKHVQNLCDHFGLKRQEVGLKRNRREDLITLATRYSIELSESGVTSSRVVQSISLPEESISEKLATRPIFSRGEAIDASIFYGRVEELSELERWIVVDHCRLVGLLGLSGIGKTALSVKLAEQIQRNFEFVIWRSLRDAPPFHYLLSDLLQVLSQSSAIELPENLGGQISSLMQYLHRHRCLLVFDEMEAILRSDRVGYYPKEHEGYSELLRRVAEEKHQSCVVITSREKPKEFFSREGQNLPVRSLLLKGLETSNAQKILEIGGISGSEEDYKNLIQVYGGNPLTLKLVTTTIEKFFNKEISHFLVQNTFAFDGIFSILEKQFDRLSDLEKQIVYWLAINRITVSLEELREDVVLRIPNHLLLGSLQSLEQRSLLEIEEQETRRFTLQPIVMEYVTLKFIEAICEEIEAGTIQHIKLLNSHALIKAQADDYVKDEQIDQILNPISDCLTSLLTHQEKEKQINALLEKIQKSLPSEPGYAAGNLINLLCHMAQTDLTNRDFSQLSIWQADLQNINLHHTKFDNCHFKQSVFTEILGDVLSVAFSPDGKFLAAGDAEGSIHIWRLPIREKHSVLTDHTSWVRSVAFSPDSRFLISGGDDQTIRVWSITNDCFQHHHVLTQVENGHKDWVRSVAYSPDNQFFISCGDDYTVKAWNAETYALLQDFQHGDRVRAVAVSPNSQTLASGGDENENGEYLLKLWDINQGKCIREFKEHTDRIRAIAFSPDETLIASGGSDHRIILWNIETGRSQLLEGHQDKIRSITFHPDGKVLISCGDDCLIKIWSVASGECLKTLQGHSNLIWSVAFNADGSRFVSGSDCQQLKLWNSATGKCLKTLQGYSSGIRSVVFVPQQTIKKQLTQSQPYEYALVSGGDDGVVRVWNTATDDQPILLGKHEGRVRSVAVSPNGKYLASGGGDRCLKLWDVIAGKELKTLTEHTDWVRTVSFSPNGKLLASGGGEKILVWDVKHLLNHWRSGDRPIELSDHKGSVRTVAFDPNSQLLASGGDDQIIRVWDVQTRKPRSLNHRHAHRIHSVAFSSNGQLLASGSDDCEVRLWDVKTGQCLKDFRGHKSGIQAVAFSPKDAILASCSDDKTVKLWDINTYDHIATLEENLGGHRGWVRSVAFSPDGSVLASGSQDSSIILWNVQRNIVTRTLKIARPYEGMTIRHIAGLNKAQTETLIKLGAIDS